MTQTWKQRAWTEWCEQGTFLLIVLAAAGTIAGVITRVRWDLYGDGLWLNWYFRYPNAILLALFGVVELSFRVFAVRQFARGDALRPGWILLTVSAGFHALGRTLAGVAGVLPSSPHSLVEPALVRSWGEMLGGPFQMVFLLAGLLLIARRMTKLGLGRRWTIYDRFLLGLLGLLTVRTLYGIGMYIAAGTPITVFKVAGWFSDPLLICLLAVSIFLWRGSEDLGQGPLAKCWKALVVAIVLTSLGDFSLWCTDCTVMPKLNTVGWHVWLLADAAFALAPAYQAMAIVRVRERRRSIQAIGRFVARPVAAPVLEAVR